MSNWKRWPEALLNEFCANIEHPDRIVYPTSATARPSSLRAITSGNMPSPNSASPFLNAVNRKDFSGAGRFDHVDQTLATRAV